MTHDAYTRWFGRLAFPAFDRLNGTTIAPKLSALLAREYDDPEDIARQQQQRLADAVGRAGRTRFYTQFWSRPGAMGPPSQHRVLDGLPILSKADLAAAAAAFPDPAYRGRLVACRTSGSTGSPMTFYRSVEQDSWFWALRFRMWSWAGYKPGDPYLEINLNPRTPWKKRLQDLVMRCEYLTFNADDQDSARISTALQRRRIPHLNGFSSSLFVLARYMLERGIANSAVVGITSTGDTLYPSYRQTVEAAFGARVIDYYGAGGEGVHLASQCPLSGSRYHLHPENALVEILGPDGPVPPGIPGRIVITQFHNDAMPLIRYELGDVAVAAPAAVRCDCGRTLPMLDRIEGRIPDLIVAPDGSFLVPHFFVVLFKNLQRVHRYQIIQEERDCLLVRLVGRPDAARRAIEKTIQREVTAATRGSLAIDCEWVDEIPLNGAGKRRLVVSRVSRDLLGGEPSRACTDTSRAASA